MALNLLAAFNLTQNLGSGAAVINNTNFSNLNNWTPGLFSSITSQASNNLTFPLFTNIFGVSGSTMVSPAFVPPIGSGYGNNFRVTLTVNLTCTGNQRIRATAVAGFGDVAVSNWVVIPPGVTVVNLDFYTAISFDNISIQTTTDPAGPVTTASYSLSNVTVSALDNTLFTNFNIGDRILVYWDDVALTYFVQLEDNPGATLTTITTGPNLPFLRDEDVSGVTGTKHVTNPGRGQGNWKNFISNYKICNGTVLREWIGGFYTPFSFPYVALQDTADAAECAVAPIVCDLVFVLPFSTTSPTNLYSIDGSIHVYAYSSHTSQGPPKFSLSDVLYAEMTNSNGIFTGLGVGTYTVYARDQYNCRAVTQITISSPFANTYSPIFRQEWKDIQLNLTGRTDILERGFGGSVTDVTSDAVPFVLTKNQGEVNNKFDSIRPTLVTMNLLSRTNFQFMGLFSQDDRKYRVQHYKDTGSGLSLEWSGYITPSVYGEAYQAPPYVSTITATDNLALLDSIDFLDDSLNILSGQIKLISIVANILRKTGLTLNILCGINRFATGMSTGGNNDPLDQAGIKCESFYNEEDGTPWNCARVLDSILKSFGAFIIQDAGRWNIIEVEAQYTTYNYRIFDSNGAVQSNATFNPIQEINDPSIHIGQLFADNNARLEVMPAYGKISITQNLRTIPSLMPLSLDSWQLNRTNAGGISIIPFAIPGTKYKGLQFSNLTANKLKYVDLISPPFTLISANDSVEVSFKYKYLFTDDIRSLGGYRNPVWVRLTWKLKLTVASTDFYFSEISGWNSNPNYTENFIYVTDFSGEDSSFTKRIKMPLINPAASVTVQLSFKIVGSLFNDFNNLAAMKAIATTILPVDSKIKGNISNSDWSFVTGTGFWFYNLTSGTDPESNSASENPLIIRPNDYNASTNAVVWKIDPKSNTLTKPVENIFISEALVKFFPNDKNPLDTVAVTFNNNDTYKENLKVDLETGDLPTSIINDNLYLNVYRLNNGIPTSGWGRVGFTEQLALQNLLMKNYANQYSRPSWRLSGSFMAFSLFRFINVLKHTIPPQVITLVNQEFATISGWTNFGATGSAWAASAGNTKVKATVTGVTQSKPFLQSAALSINAGARVQVILTVDRTASNATARIDTLYIVLYKNGVPTQEISVGDFQYDVTGFAKTVRFSVINDADNIGFYVKNIIGPTGGGAYELDYFRVSGLSTVRYYQPAQLERNDRDNDNRAQVEQLIPAILSTDPTIDDAGGGNTGGDTPIGGGGNGGNSFGGDFNNDFGGDFDTILN